MYTRLGRLLCDTVLCMHLVEPTFDKTRISLLFFIYASPTGTIDQSLNERVINVAKYLCDNPRQEAIK